MVVRTTISTLTSLIVMLLLEQCYQCFSFALVPSSTTYHQLRRTHAAASRRITTSTAIQQSSSSTSGGYVPPQEDERSKSKAAAKAQRLYPKAGDFVRYYDLDGGKADGQVLVGRIRFISKNMGGEGSGWTLELTEMESVGDGYYADYGSRQRWAKGSDYRDLLDVSPLTASFVRSQDAYKIPTKAVATTDATTTTTNAAPPELLVRAEQYDVEGYEGPFGAGGDAASAVDTAVVEADAVLYDALKGKLLRYAAIAGAVGTLVADLTRGTEAAAIYFAGVVSSLLYLVFLSLKTDTIGTEKAGFGKNLSNLRFAMPLVVMVGVALYNLSLGDANPLLLVSDSGNGRNLFQTVTPEQFAAVVLGFLTYRLPLLLIQVEGAFQDDSGGGDTNAALLPGSTGMALQLAMQNDDEAAASATAATAAATTTSVLLISGPQATGRPELVEKLIEQGEGKFITPALMDRVKDGAAYERCEQRGEFLYQDESGRFGLTKQAIVDTGKDATNNNDKVLVINASVDLAKKLTKVSELRLVGVWVGLSSVKEFEQRLGAMIDEGRLAIVEDETRETTIRAKIREIVKEIEYGISSGVFEFTVLNDDESSSLKQIREASKYVN